MGLVWSSMVADERINHAVVLKLHGEFDLIYYSREVVAEEISSEEQRGASKQVSEQASEVQKAFDRQGVHGRNYWCGPTTTTTTTHSLLGK